MLLFRHHLKLEDAYFIMLRDSSKILIFHFETKDTSFSILGYLDPDVMGLPSDPHLDFSRCSRGNMAIDSELSYAERARLGDKHLRKVLRVLLLRDYTNHVPCPTFLHVDGSYRHVAGPLRHDPPRCSPCDLPWPV